jgi:hypothetical protein
VLLCLGDPRLLRGPSAVADLADLRAPTWDTGSR